MSDNIDLKLLGRRLETIQTELREIKINIAVDRDRFDSLTQVMGKQLGEVEAKLLSRLDGFETLINARYDHSETQFAEVGTRLGSLEARFSEVGTRLDRVETQLTNNTESMNQLIAGVEQLLSKG